MIKQEERKHQHQPGSSPLPWNARPNDSICLHHFAMWYQDKWGRLREILLKGASRLSENLLACSSQLLLHAHFTKDCFLNCNFSKLLRWLYSVLQWKMSLKVHSSTTSRQSSNGKGCGLHQWSNGDTHNTKHIHTIPFHYSPDPHADVGWGRIASHHCSRLWTTSTLSSILSRSLVT